MRRRHTPPGRSAKPDASAVGAAEALAIDFPQEVETIAPGPYTIRVSAPAEAQAVEVCVNRSPWLACRRESGYWWGDWAAVEPGFYQARARMRTADGQVRMTLLRSFNAGL